MACPKIEVRGKRVILLSGFHGSYDGVRSPVEVKDADVKAAELYLETVLVPLAIAAPSR